MILHTESYTYEENIIISNELNDKFGFNSTVISHKQKYWVIKFNKTDNLLLKKFIEPHVHPSFKYKIPKV